MSAESPEEYRAAVWKLLAFTARYGHTDPFVAMEMPRRDLQAFSSAIGDLLREENTPNPED